MDNLKQIDWHNYVSDKHKWVDEHLKAHSPIESGKFVTRFYSVSFSGTQQELTALVDSIADSIVHYVYDSKQLEQMKNNNIEPFRKASGFFGNTNPDMDGKYGELLLYIMTEAILKTPMVSHKISLLTNKNDQVKGGDGIFFGNYNGSLSILIGESKIHKNHYGAIDDALDSLNRFHSEFASGTLEHELFIARSNISDNFDLEDLKSLYQAFKPGTENYKNCNKTHPVLLVFEMEEISSIEEAAKNKNDAEEIFGKWILEKSKEINNHFIKKLNSYNDLKKVYIDVFLLPLANVSSFKKSLYKAIHGIDYVPPCKEEKAKKISKKPKKQD